MGGMCGRAFGTVTDSSYYLIVFEEGAEHQVRRRSSRRTRQSIVPTSHNSTKKVFSNSDPHRPTLERLEPLRWDLHVPAVPSTRPCVFVTRVGKEDAFEFRCHLTVPSTASPCTIRIEPANETTAVPYFYAACSQVTPDSTYLGCCISRAYNGAAGPSYTTSFPPGYTGHLHHTVKKSGGPWIEGSAPPVSEGSHEVVGRGEDLQFRDVHWEEESVNSPDHHCPPCEPTPTKEADGATSSLLQPVLQVRSPSNTSMRLDEKGKNLWMRRLQTGSSRAGNFRPVRHAWGDDSLKVATPRGKEVRASQLSFGTPQPAPSVTGLSGGAAGAAFGDYIEYPLSHTGRKVRENDASIHIVLEFETPNA
eukprot:TRINITY_DN7747_c0_g1_i1.p1 TRINITY_DN7747_c0_g1~~TRINITY_DN7747_c0_g1_i1.p1  ORF type:complete len:363 (+),score=6.35 TRINITY_DN7747_c0_g1_i1:99-1187(+)